MSKETEAGEALPIAILGAGEAGSACAAELVRAGREVVLIAPRGEPDVELPPLSKTLFAESLTLTPHRVDSGNVPTVTAHAVGIDPESRRVSLSTGEEVRCSSLVIATGASARDLAIDLPGGPAFTLHSRSDAEAIRTAVAAEAHSEGQRTDIGIVGSGFLALELARGAADAGYSATVYLSGSSPLSLLSRVMSETIMRLHESAGVRFVADSTPADYMPHDLWLVAVGARADTAFAGDDVQRGANGALLTDAQLRVLDSAGNPREFLYPIGDCARVAHGPMAGYGRLESEPMATSQGAWLGRQLSGLNTDVGQAGDAWQDLPWHWSFQGPVRLFTAGLSAAASDGDPVVLGDPAGGRGQVALFASGADSSPLVGMETLGTPKHQMAARRLLAAGPAPTRAEVRDPEFDLVAYSRLVRAREAIT